MRWLASLLQRTLVFKQTLGNMRIPWTARSNQSNLKEISAVFIGRSDADAETPILWPPDVKFWLIGKDPDAGKEWRQEEKGTTEIVWWHHRLDGHEFDQAQGVGDGQEGAAVHGITKSQTWLSDWPELGYSERQRSLASCSPLGHRVRCDLVTEQGFK